MKQKIQLNAEGGEITHTEASENILGGKIAPTFLGKFKDVESLLKAYDALQAEFTKRCQLVKALEGEVESLRLSTNGNSTEKEQTASTACNKKTQDETICFSENSRDNLPTEPVNVDKPPEIIEENLQNGAELPSESNDKKTVDDGESINAVLEFFQNYPSAIKYCGRLSNLIGNCKATKENLLKAFLEVLLEKAENPIRNEEVIYENLTPSLKERIIKEYLITLRGDGKAATLIGGGGVIPLTPPLRPKNVAEAGALAKNIIKIK